MKIRVKNEIWLVDDENLKMGGEWMYDLKYKIYLSWKGLVEACARDY